MSQFVFIMCLIGQRAILGELTNVALGKPTYHSSQYKVNTPGRAVDGNANSNFAANSCQCTNHQPYPWWVVDLGGPHVITQARITNRGDALGHRLHDFYVGILDVNPSVQAPTIGSYDTCAFHAGQVAQGATAQLTLSCPRSARYVIVQINAAGSVEMLTMCEVVIMGLKGKCQYNSCVNNNALRGHVIVTVQARDVIECGVLCQGNDQCSSFNYEGGHCELNSMSAAPTATSTELTAAPGYKYCTIP